MRPASLSRAALLSSALSLVTILFGRPDGSPGPISLIQADPHHKGTLIAGTATARLFRSRDDGDTWSPLPFPGESRSSLHAMLIDPERPNVYWVAVSSETPQFAGLFFSADEGATWAPVTGMERKQVWSLAFWKVDAHVIAAGTEDGVYLTRDGGKSWTIPSLPGGLGPHPVVSLAFDPANAATLYAGTPHLPWKTVDGGADWLPIHNGIQEDSDIFALGVDLGRRSRVMAAACSGIYRSLDGGGSWLNLEHSLGGQFRSYTVIWSPDHRNEVYAGTSEGVLVSRDGGATWRRLSVHPARSVALDPDNPHRLFVATDQGVVRIEDSSVPARPVHAAHKRPGISPGG